MAISKVTLPDNSTQDIKDSRLPDVTADNNGKSLAVVDGEWAVGNGSGRWAFDDRRIITSGTTCPLYRYKICGFGRHGRLVPLTITDQTTTTIVQKTPVSVGIDPQRGLVYYGGTTNYTSVNSVVGNLFPTSSRIDGRYTFNSTIAVRNEIYLKGTYADHLFTLDTTSSTSWYVCADLAAVNSSTYFSVFTSGSYYMLVGTTGSTANMIDLKENNPLFYYDGTYLVQVNFDTRVASGDLVYEGDALGSATYTADGEVVDLSDYQLKLESGTNIKTINNESILGSGNITISGGSGGEANVIEAITFNGTPATITNKTAAITATIPSAVTESTVSGWGFTKNTGTLTGVSFNGNSATVTNGVAAITATIQTVPTISTNITTDASSDAKTASPKAVKTYVDGIVGDIETLLAAI